MNWLIIENLLKRYWEGETSLAEEQQIKDAFKREDIPAHLKSYKSYFTFVVEQHLIEHPHKDFEVELLQNLKVRNRLAFPTLLAYAAGLLLLLSIAFFLTRNNDINTPDYVPLTANEMQVAQKYLGFLSKNLEQSMAFSSQNLEKFKLLNKGAETIQQYENAYQKQIKNLKQVDYIDQSFIKLKYLKTFENSRIRL